MDNLHTTIPLIGSIVPIIDNKIYLTRQRSRKDLSYSGKYTLYYTYGDINDILRAFDKGTMGLFPIKTIETALTVGGTPYIDYYIATIDTYQFPEEIFEAVSTYFTPCFHGDIVSTTPLDVLYTNGNILGQPPGYEEYVSDVPACDDNSFERDDLLVLNLDEWLTSNRRGWDLHGMIYRPDWYILDLIARMRYRTTPIPSTIVNPYDFNLLEGFVVQTAIDIDRLNQTLYDQKNRNYNQVGVIPISLNEYGEVVILISQERYEERPWSFFTGKPLTNKDLRALKSSKTTPIEVDYYDAALREYYEESMGILEEIIPIDRTIFVTGRERLGTYCSLWPVHVEYEQNIGRVYQQIANYTRERQCLDDKEGKMSGKCAESHVEKINAMWLTKNEALNFILGRRPNQRPTWGVKIFRDVYEDFISRLPSSPMGK